MYLYCLLSKFTDKILKLGLTTDPPNRLRVYRTGEPPGFESKFMALWKVNATSKAELAELEQGMHNHFSLVRQFRLWGTKCEWFEVSFEDVEKYMNSQAFVIRQLSIEEINVIEKKSKSDDSDNFAPNLFVPSPSPTFLKDEFFTTFLPQGCTPRPIQNELWDLWEGICNQDQQYKGIVQWPTATGKTIAMLLLFFLSATTAKKKGEIFRGLLIAPTNDIFETIIDHINKLSKYGIKVFKGYNGNLSSLSIPSDKHILVTTTHQSLTDLDMWDKLPNITHVHYDEVHRITGDEFLKNLQTKFVFWNTKFLTGTSATPITSARKQNEKFAELFGDPLQIIHQCKVEDAIQEGWIAKPRFGVNIIRNDVPRDTIIRQFVNTIHSSIIKKMNDGLWKGGKVIAYLPFRNEACKAVDIAKEIMPDWNIFSAVENADALNDAEFKNTPSEECPSILFSCERYREGSDIKGIEMTVILMGNTISAYILLQIIGRTLRNDYKDKEGWCIIFRPCDEETTEEEVFNDIVLQITEFIGKDKNSLSNKENIKSFVDRFFVSDTITGTIFNVQETIDRIQLMFSRKVLDHGNIKEKYDVIRSINIENKLESREQYEKDAFIENPKSYFKDNWISWYHFLGIDTSNFPPTKMDWINKCKQLSIKSWDDYKQKNDSTLPPDPSEMYDDYTNWDNEMGCVAEHDW